MAKKDKSGAGYLKDLSRKSTRMEAVARLGELGAVEAIGPLLRLCKRVDDDGREAIVRALAQMGAAAVKALVEEGARSATRRRCAARALGAIGPDARRAVKPLLKWLDDGTTGVRVAVIEALGAIGDPRAVESLAACLSDDDREVREAAAQALGMLGEGALPAVRQVWEEGALQARVAAAHALAAIGGEQAESLLRAAFSDDSAPPEFRVAILAALGELLAEGVMPFAIAALQDPDPRLRRQAVRCLVAIDAPEAMAHLMASRRDDDKKVRSLALKGLQSRYRQLLDRVATGDEEALHALLDAWRAMGKKRAAEAAEIEKALVGMGRQLLPALLAALDVERPCADVIAVLAKMGATAAEAFDALAAQLDNNDVDTCCAAARALGALGDERAAPLLAARLSFDPALLQAKKHRERRARKRALALQEAAALGLGRLGRVALPLALDAARSGDPVTRRGGVMALGYIGGGRALAVLERAVDDPDPMVREAAAEAMERAAADDVTRLARMLKSDDERVRVKAVEALGRLGDLRSLDLLLRAYGDRSKKVNKAVVKALARREGERALSVLIAAAAGGNVTALRALTRHPSRDAIPALIEALDSPWYDVYSTALAATRAYVDLFGKDKVAREELRKAIPALIYLLHDDMAETRRMAAETLGALRDPAAVSEIAFLLMDDKREVRMAALRALESIGGEEAIRALTQCRAETPDEDLRAEIADALARMGVPVPAEEPLSDQGPLPEPV